MNIKLDFSSSVYEQINQQFSIIDSFKGNWNAIEGQKNRYKEEERIDSWMLFFLECLILLTQRLEAKYETYSKLKTVLNERQQSVLSFVEEHKNAQIGGLATHLKDYSRNTLKKILPIPLKKVYY